MICTLFPYCVIGSKSEFDKFSKRFKEISFPLIINDSLAFANWSKEDFIDTNSIIQYKLIERHKVIEQFIVKKDSLKNLSDYLCSYFGRYESEYYTVLMYKLYTTRAGRGNPLIILATFNKEGKKEDEIAVFWNDVDDPLYNRRITLNIPNSNKIEIKSIVIYNGLLKDEIVLKKTIEILESYEIQASGKIIVCQKITKDVYYNDNPEILDDFPQE